jgi:hypothetical protein
MLLLRAGLLELLVCFHVIGGAVVFRRLFPRESPWLAFIVPIFIVMSACNFIEHFVALASPGWLLPFTLLGLLWAIGRPGYSWEGLLLPCILFLVIFTWDLFIMAQNPSITCNTEGVADMARVLDFCLGNKLPPVDTWCPPYDHGGYYSFQHYGASLVKRLFSLDIGTGYNMGYNLLNTLTVFVGAGAAYSISGRKTWVAVATLLVLLANFSGASVLLLYWNTAHPVANLYDVFDSRLAIDIGDGWNDPDRHNPFGWIWEHRDPPPVLRLFTPAFNTYFPEFHANLGGHFMTLATLLAANEAFKTERSNWPWICLLLFPIITIITATWFIVVVSVLCVGCLTVALIAGKRPENWQVVLGGSALAFVLLWPSVNSLIAGTYPVDIHWTPWSQYTAPWEFIIQWWPVIVPWVALIFIWGRLSLLVRWIHIAVPLLLIFFEMVTFGDRGLTIEKNWGAIYGTSLVTFFPLVFIERKGFFRLLTIVFLFISTIFIFTWGYKCVHQGWPGNVLHFRGDVAIVVDPQKQRILQVLERYHGVTVLSGKSAEAYNECPSAVGFSENMCYIAWFFQEFQCGHGGEAEFRDRQSNDFFAGTMTNPLAFLRSNNITAVVVYPDDEIPDNIVQKLKDEIGSDYYYIDCKKDMPKNAGVFVLQPYTPQNETPPVAPTPTNVVVPPTNAPAPAK